VAQRGVFIATLVAFFIAEIGDKTQVATIALAAAYSSLHDQSLRDRASKDRPHDWFLPPGGTARYHSERVHAVRWTSETMPRAIGRR
jgi:hypothetical protein